MLVSNTRKKVRACGEGWSRLDRSALGLAEVGRPGGERVGGREGRRRQEWRREQWEWEIKFRDEGWGQGERRG